MARRMPPLVFALFAVLFLVSGLPLRARGADPALLQDFFDGGQIVRVGIFMDKLSAELEGKGPFTVVDETTGQVIFRGDSGEKLQILMVNGASLSPTKVWRVQVTAASTRDGALSYKEEIEKLTDETVHVEYIDPWYKVQIGDFSDKGQALRLRDQLKGKGVDGWPVVFTMPGSEPGTLIVKRRGEVVFKEARFLRVRPLSEGLLAVYGKPFRGDLIFHINESGRFDIINYVNLEEYLYGVLGAEMRGVSEEEFEALKAQAVAARTYAVSNLGRFADRGYDLCNTTMSQVYFGYSRETEMIRKAVDETAGLIATYGDEAIDAVYHSNAGGHTADSESVWPGRIIPYLRGMPETGVDRKTGQAVEFGKDDPRYRWELTWDAKQLHGIFQRYLAAEAGHPDGTDIGEIVDLKVSSVDKTGRVRELDVFTTTGVFTVAGDRIRWVLRPPGDHVLPSLKFILSVQREDDRLRAVKVVGYGSGHGLGMSQYGAMSMAASGYTFAEILKHYYQGIEILSLTDYIDYLQVAGTAAENSPLRRRGVLVLLSKASGPPRGLAWSPDGVKLGFTTGDYRQLRVIDVVSRREWPIVEAMAAGVGFKWSLDGRKMGYFEYLQHPKPFQSKFSLKTVPSEGGSATLEYQGVNLSSLNWAPQGVLFLEEDGVLKLVWGKTASELIPGARYPSVAPDGKSIAYITNRELWLYEISSGERRKVCKQPLTGEITWSPDRQFLAVDMSGFVYVVSVDTGEIAYVAVGNDPTFSYDGRYLAYSRADYDGPTTINSDIYAVKVGVWKEVNLTATGHAVETDPRWAPDSLRIAYVRSHQRTVKRTGKGDSAIWVVTLQER